MESKSKLGNTLTLITNGSWEDSIIVDSDGKKIDGMIGYNIHPVKRKDYPNPMTVDITFIDVDIRTFRPDQDLEQFLADSVYQPPDQ